jgi:sec-independent protein translocase protein TatC
LVKIGLFTPDFLIKYRKHAIVVILILAAVITPPDVISQVIVTIPIYLLFEVSILVATRVVKQEKN